jgi:hypothetical protein
MLQINIGKGLTVDVDTKQFNEEVFNHIIKIGLKNLLGDSHAGITAKAHPTDFVEKSREAAQRKLQALYDGVTRTQGTGNGFKAPTDPVAMVVLRLARKHVQKALAAELAAAPKDQRLAVLNKLATEYASAHDATLRPRAMQIVALENDEPVAAKPAPIKPKGKK